MIYSEKFERLTDGHLGEVVVDLLGELAHGCHDNRERAQLVAFLVDPVFAHCEDLENDKR